MGNGKNICLQLPALSAVARTCLIDHQHSLLLCMQKVYVGTFVRRGANLGNKLCKYDKAC